MEKDQFQKYVDSIKSGHYVRPVGVNVKLHQFIKIVRAAAHNIPLWGWGNFVEYIQDQWLCRLSPDDLKKIRSEPMNHSKAVQESQAMQKDLESGIQELVHSFEKKYGMTISDIHIERVDARTHIEREASTPIIEPRIKTTIEL